MKLFTSLIALALVITPIHAGIRTVTNVTGGTTVTGSFGYELLQMVDQDTLLFHDDLKTQTIDIGDVMLNANGKQSYNITIIGDGVTLTSRSAQYGDATLQFGRNANEGFASVKLEKLHFSDVNNIVFAYAPTIVTNCTFRITSQSTGTVGVSVTRSDKPASFVGCAFMAEANASQALYISGAGAKSFVSCTFVYLRTAGVLFNSGAGMNTFTNCAFVDPGATSRRSIFASANVTSNGHNVILGSIKAAWTAAPAWKQGSDIYLNPATPNMADSILKLENNKYKVVYAGGKGKAYRHLPRRTTIAGITFPTQDLSGIPIDYTATTHSGAWQDVYTETGEVEVPEAPEADLVQSITIAGPDTVALWTGRTNKFIATVLPPTAESGYTWSIVNPDHTIATIDEDGNFNATASQRSETLYVTVVVTSKGFTSDGITQAADNVVVKIKTYINVTGIDMPNDTVRTFVQSYEDRLTATIYPDNATNPPTIQWTVDDPTIATVYNANNVAWIVRGLRAGATKVRATITENGQNFVDSCLYIFREAQYQNAQGVFFINEGNYPGTGDINYLSTDDQWDYTVYERMNPNETLGVTTQFATIYGDKIYFVSKQQHRLVVADPKTMTKIAAFDKIGTGDGRSFLGVNDTTAYVGSSVGVHKVHLPTMHDARGTSEALPHEMIFESGGGGGGQDALTRQAGTMIRVENKIFVVQQNVGIIVINAHTHTVETTLTISGGYFATLTLAHDGNLWAGTSATASGELADDQPRNVIVKINPYTLQMQQISLPQGLAGPVASWGAWRVDAVAASDNENILYWKVGNNIYRYDMDSNTARKIFDANNCAPLTEGTGWATAGKWSMYGGFGLHPVTNLLYIPLVTMDDNPDNRLHWQVIKLNPNTETSTIVPIKNYFWWFAMILFPDNYTPTFNGTLPNNVTFSESYNNHTVNLKGVAADPDNMDAAIVFSAIADDDELVNLSVNNNQLVITPRKTITQGQTSETTNVTLTANSNGKTIQHHFNVTLEAGTKGDQQHQDGNSNFDPINNPFELTLHTLQLYTGQQAQLALTAPQHFITKWNSDDKTIANVNQYGTITTHHTGQVYIIAQDSTTGKYDQCLLIISDLPNYQDQTNPVVQINNSELRLAKGQTTQLKIVAAHHLNTTTNWQTTNHHVADVTDNGTVIAVNPGYATITLKTSDGAQTHCYVYVTPPVTQPIVYDLKTDQVTLDFPKLARANNYLLHLYLIKFNKGTPGLTPVYTLKVNQYGGLVNTKAPQGNILTAKLDKLLPFNSYIVWIETIITDSVENTQILATESVAFTTLKTTDIQQVDNEQAKVLYHNGILTLINMQESNVIAVNTQGNVVLNVDVTQIIQLVHAKLKTGVYILQQKKKNQSKIYKIFVR